MRVPKEYGCLYKTQGIECKDSTTAAVNPEEFKKQVCSQCVWGPNGKEIRDRRMQVLSAKEN